MRETRKQERKQEGGRAKRKIQTTKEEEAEEKEAEEKR